MHRQDPEASDEALDAVIADPETLSQIQNELEVPDHELGLRIAKTISAIYGVEWRDDEKDS